MGFISYAWRLEFQIIPTIRRCVKLHAGQPMSCSLGCYMPAQDVHHHEIYSASAIKRWVPERLRQKNHSHGWHRQTDTVQLLSEILFLGTTGPYTNDDESLTGFLQFHDGYSWAWLDRILGQQFLVERNLQGLIGPFLKRAGPNKLLKIIVGLFPPRPLDCITRRDGSNVGQG